MIDANVLGQLLLMQTVLISLPETDSFFSFICRGLEDLPGIASVRHSFDKKPIVDDSVVLFMLSRSGVSYGQIELVVSDYDQYLPYDDCLRNFMFMVEIILEERRQKRLSVECKLGLEKLVNIRDQQLSKESKEKYDIQEALIESENKYEQIFNATSDGILVHDIDGDQIYDANEPFLKMFGFKKSEILQTTPDFLSSGVSPYDKDGVKNKIEQVIKEGPQIFEWQAKKSNGEFFWIEIYLTYTSIAGKNVVISAVRDISVRKQTQEMLIHNEKMISVGGLAAGIAHEINNPLSAMMLSANILLNRLYGQKKQQPSLEIARELGLSYESLVEFMDRCKVRKMLNSLLESGERISDIVSNTLNFTRKSSAEPTNCDVTKILDKSIELVTTGYDLEKQYDFKSIEFYKDYQSDLPQIKGHASKLQQVFINLLVNGAQAMCSSGKEQLQFNLRLRFIEDEQHILIEIEDNGPGMTEFTRTRVFEPFYTTKNPSDGTGLGLSVSYFIITTEHGGQMSVESQFGVGSKFIIKLPVE